MITLYYYLVLANAAVSLAVAVSVYWRNRYLPAGLPFGVAFVVLAIWLVGFAQYFHPLSQPTAMLWARITVVAAFVNPPFLFHGMCAMVGREQRFRWWIVTAYATTVGLLILLLQGNLILGLTTARFMHHYVAFDRTWYGVLSSVIVFWQVLGGCILGYTAWRAVGYQRTQLVYFIVAWFTSFATLNFILIPIQYQIDIPPVGLFVMPFNLAFLGYVMGKARLADYNVVIARVLLYAVTMLAIVGVSLLFVGVMARVAPNFMNQEQLMVSVMLASAIGIGLTLGLPRFLPRAERIMQERLFGSRAGYQDALSGLVRQLGTMPSIDQLMATVATTVHSQMQLTRVLVFMEDPLSGRFRVRAESGLNTENTEAFALESTTPLLRWLQEQKRVFVRDEVARQVPERVMRELDSDLDRLGAVVCIPTLVEDRLSGVIALGPKANNEMFFMSDLNLLNNLGTELALVVRYRRVEEEIFHKNKLIELGTIAAGVAHELRNPIASISTFAQLLPEKIDDPEFRDEFAKRVQEDVKRITKVIENMLAFARPAQVMATEHTVSDLVEDSIILTTTKLKSKQIELTKEFHESPVVKVDKPKLQQVLINLISNAVDALPEKGKIRVATGVRWMEDSTNGNQRKRYAVIEIEDNGPGIPAAVRNRLFDPFFTTKKEGTGLGLSISQKILRDHGGLITLSSVEGKGTTFQVNLPLG